MKSYIKIHLLLGFFCILVLVSPGIFSQGDENLKSMFVEAESFFLFEEYKDALPLYQRLLQSDPENFNLNYKIGICYLNDIYQYQKSLSYLETAVKGISPESKTNSFKEKKAPPYSVLNPETNSDSDSLKSKGARWVSAKVQINQITKKMRKLGED